MIFTSTTPGELSFLTWKPVDQTTTRTKDCARRAYEEIGAHLRANHQLLMHERVYGELGAVEPFLQVRSAVQRDLDIEMAVPPTWVEGAPCTGPGVAGIHAIAVAAETSSQVVECEERAFGRLVRGSDAEYLFLSDVSSLIGERLAAAEETRLTFELVEKTLARLQWSFNDICRTWFYLHHILDWYDAFNLVRNEAFKRTGLFSNGSPRPIPASTGIRGCNPRRSWCTLDLLAIRALDSQPLDVRRLRNPQQNEAPEYGSAFSRGLQISTGRCRYLFVSGTASIDQEGRSVFDGDFEAQTECTLETVASLLGAAGAGLDDICQATAFVKRAEDVDKYQRIVERMGFEKAPAVCTIGDVCRPELLFELDATAVLPP